MSSHDGKRKFHDLPTTSSISSHRNNMEKRTDEESGNLLKFISNDVIGKDYEFDGPFGRRPITYCDYTASGRALSSIEDYIKEKILPAYGNTHTTTTVTSLQSSMFLSEARMMIRNACRANEHDAVVFVGNGVTGAINKLIHAMNFQQSPVVFVGPFEHHSNLLPWREIAAHVVYISEDEKGQINLEHLEMALKSWQSQGVPLVGCFSAASNVTGVVSDTVGVSSLLHQYGCLSLWDYATAAPYLDIDMHPPYHNGDASKDAVFLSIHKFIGGVDCPGVLIAKKSLFRNRLPSESGGGAVFFVSRDNHRYLQDIEMREEAGTIRVVGAVRSALAIKLKQSVGADTIMRMEAKHRRRALKVWREIPQMKILGDYGGESPHHLAIFSFVILNEESGKYLHHNYVATLLNDIFGIQSRGGCACAGPYAQHLLGIDTTLANIYEQVLLEDSRLDRTHLRRQSEYSSNEILRPGFTRLNLSYFSSDDVVDYVIKAVGLVARYGWMLLPQYMFNPESGEWNHITHKIFSDRRWIEHTMFTCEGLKVTDPISKFPHETASSNYQQLLDKGRDILLSADKTSADLADHTKMFTDVVQPLLWFLLPSQALKLVRKQEINKFDEAVFHPATKPHLLNNEEMMKMSSIPPNFHPTMKKAADQQLVNGNKPTVEVTNSGDAPSSAEDLACLMGKCILKRREMKPATTTKTSSKIKFVNPPKSLINPTIAAIEKFKMINNGDKVLVCLSGGKDSLSLLHVLRQYQYIARGNDIIFDLGAMTIDPMTSSYDPSPLKGYLKQLGVTYFYEEQGILDQAMEVAASSICSFCSRMKRGRMYHCARREGWNVLAMGQHLDDLAETFLMSAFHNGTLFTMKANYRVKDNPEEPGEVRVIRPFVYVRETQTRDFAESNKLPIIPENCPACFEAPKERHRVKQLLASQEILHRKIFNNLKSAIEPLMSKGVNQQHNNQDEDDQIEN